MPDTHLIMARWRRSASRRAFPGSWLMARLPRAAGPRRLAGRAGGLIPRAEIDADPYYTAPGVRIVSIRTWTPVVGP